MGSRPSSLTNVATARSSGGKRLELDPDEVVLLDRSLRRCRVFLVRDLGRSRAHRLELQVGDGDLLGQQRAEDRQHLRVGDRLGELAVDLHLLPQRGLRGVQPGEHDTPVGLGGDGGLELLGELALAVLARPRAPRPRSPAACRPRLRSATWRQVRTFRPLATDVRRGQKIDGVHAATSSTCTGASSGARQRRAVTLTAAPSQGHAPRPRPRSRRPRR